MSTDHGPEENNESESEPVNFVDNRRVDPETGEVRSQGGQPEDEVIDAEVVDAEDVDPNSAAADGDALAQAEEILNSTEGADNGAGAADSAHVAELRTDLQRLQAEYVNYRKRVERDRAVASELAVVGVLNSLLPVLDDIDAGRAAGDLADGPIAAIAAKLESTLTRYGLIRIDETGVDFDPNIHEALMQQPSADAQTDTVAQILRAGYRSNDRILRAAQVVVAVPE